MKTHLNYTKPKANFIRVIRHLDFLFTVILLLPHIRSTYNDLRPRFGSSVDHFTVGGYF